MGKGEGEESKGHSGVGPLKATPPPSPVTLHPPILFCPL
jgi:hypothetical protein